MKASFFITLALLPWPCLAQPTAPPAAAGSGAPVSAPASAAPQPAANDPVARAAQRGKKAYDSGNYLEAAVAYQEAYRLEPVATLLYNIAYIYDEHLKDRTLAIDYYRRYVNAPDAEAASRLRAYQRIAVLEKAPPAALPTAAPVPAPATAAPVAKNTKTESSSGQTTTGVVLLAVGGASLIASGAMAFLTADAHLHFEEETERSKKQEFADQGEATALGADITLGLGVALAATGLVLILTDEGEGPVLTPSASGSGAGLSLGGRF